MKLSKLNCIATSVISILFTLILMPACNDNKDSEKNSMVSGKENENNSGVDKKAIDHPVAEKSLGKKIGRVVTAITTVDKSSTMSADKMGYYNYTETVPSFPGGQSSLESYINNNIEYPQEAIDNNAEGTVHVMFTIDENGQVGNAKTTGAVIGYGLEEEAIKVVNGMSKWTPGMIKGKKVKSWYALPITYKLEE